MNHKPDDALPEDHQFALAALVLSQGRSRKKVDSSLKQDSPSWAQNREERFVDAL
jgi:hypothetical protein